jgi:hypothetical protein
MNLYHSDGRWRRPILGYQEGSKVTGSVKPLADQVHNIQRVGIIGTVIALATAGLAAIGIFASLISPLQTNVDNTAQIRADMGSLKASVQSQQACIDQLTRYVQSKPTPAEPPACIQLSRR